MKNIIAFILFIGSFALFAPSVLAQDYQMAQLSQEPVTVTMHPTPSLPREKGDTSFTDYQGSSIPISLYVLNGPSVSPNHKSCSNRCFCEWTTFQVFL